MKLIIEDKEYEYCPQHGYPLPCAKCGLGEYERGKADCIKEVKERISQSIMGLDRDDNYPPDEAEAIREWVQSKLKEWGLE